MIEVLLYEKFVKTFNKAKSIKLKNATKIIKFSVYLRLSIQNSKARMKRFLILCWLCFGFFFFAILGGGSCAWYSSKNCWSHSCHCWSLSWLWKLYEECPPYEFARRLGTLRKLLRGEETFDVEGDGNQKCDECENWPGVGAVKNIKFWLFWFSCHRVCTQ